MLSNLLLQVSGGAETPHQPDFQPYIFWAYALACLLLLIFTLWTHRQTKSLARKVGYLTDRFVRAHPGALSEEEQNG